MGCNGNDMMNDEDGRKYDCFLAEEAKFQRRKRIMRFKVSARVHWAVIHFRHTVQRYSTGSGSLSGAPDLSHQ